MNVKKAIGVVCGITAILSLVAGVLCFFAPALTNHKNGNEKADAIAGICLCLISTVWAYLANCIHNKGVLEEEERARGERDGLIISV